MANILEGIKVVEVASFVAGPAAATQLSDFGAEVIKISRLVDRAARVTPNRERS